MAKKKFDSQAIQAWLHLHAEKLALAFCAGIFLWMVYSAWALPSYKRTPQMLADERQNAQLKIANAHDKEYWDKKFDGIVIPDPPYANQVTTALQELDPKPFQWAVAFNRPLFEDRSRREVPKLFAVDKLRAKYHQGAIAPGPNLKHLGHVWVVVTGLIPVAQQTKEYDDKFKSAMMYNPKRDVPSYYDFVIERAEVVNGTPAAYTVLKLDAEWSRLESFAQQRTEVADPRLIENFGIVPNLLVAIPPLVDAGVDESYLYPPQIEKAVGGPVQADTPQVPASKGRPRPGGTQNPMPPPAAVSQPAVEAQKPVEFKLFRFCDFGVERNKTYRYRVKLILQNPNWVDHPDSAMKLDPIALKKPEYGKSETLQTDWSAPTADVSVANDLQFALADVRAPAPGQEALAKFMTICFAAEYGVMTGHLHGSFPPNPVKTFERGTWIDFPGVKGDVRKAGKVEMIQGSVDYRFQGVLVGLSGGQEVKRLTQQGAVANSTHTVKTPGEAIILWPDGRLEIHNQLHDAVAISQIENPQPPEGLIRLDDGAANASPSPSPMPTPGKDEKKGKPSLTDILKAPSSKGTDKK